MKAGESNRLFNHIMSRYIESKENRIIKDCQRLTQKKYRDREKRYLVEGYNLVDEALKEGVELDAVILRAGEAERPDFPENTYVLERGLFDAVAQTETSQGIMAIVRKREFDAESLRKTDSGRDNYVVLDRLQDPGNIGTIIRTAEGAGYSGVICLKGTGDVYSPKVIRAAAGSVFRIPIVQVEDGRELRELVTALNKKLAVTCLNNDRYYFDEDISEGVALVIGNEGGGCSPELIKDADIRVMIPMKGKLESLNAAVAAGILMYESMR